MSTSSSSRGTHQKAIEIGSKLRMKVLGLLHLNCERNIVYLETIDDANRHLPALVAWRSPNPPVA